MEGGDLIEALLGLLFFIVIPIIRAIAERKKKKEQEARWAEQGYGEVYDGAYDEGYEQQYDPEYAQPVAEAPPQPAPVPFGTPFGAPVAAPEVVAAAISELDELVARADLLATQVRVERATYRFSKPLDEFVVGQARQMKGAAERGELPYQHLRVGLDSLWLVLEQIEQLVAQRRDPRLLPLVGDADALAKACYKPIVDFARARQMNLTSVEPVTDLGDRDLGTWAGFSPTGLAPLALPPDFFDRIAWWPALAHEIAHDFLAAAEGLNGQLREELGLVTETAGRWPLRFRGEGIDAAELYRVFGGWFEEIFCDVFGTLMVGPAYGWAMVELFPSPAEPANIVAVGYDESGLLYNTHPPRHLRLLISTYLLEQVGRERDAEQIREAWSRLHGGWPNAILFPVGRQWVPVPIDAVAGTAIYLAEQLYHRPFKALSGHRLCDIPGVDYGPHASAETDRVAQEILAGEVPHSTEARWIVAGATEAWHDAPEREAEIIALVRRGISAVGTFERAPDAYDIRDRRKVASATVEEAREAFLLHTILGPPAALRRLGAMGR